MFWKKEFSDVSLGIPHIPVIVVIKKNWVYNFLT